MLRTPRIDWAQLLRDLDAVGLSPVAVADKIGTAKSSPYRWIEGSEPLYSHGAALLQLHSMHCGIRHGEIAGADDRPAIAGATGSSNEVPVPSVGQLSTLDLDRVMTKAREDAEENDYRNKLGIHRAAQRRKR